MKMVSLGFLLVTVAATVSASIETQVHSPKAKALSAPTYYLAVSARGCTSDVIQFDGVFNLPTGSLVRISINDFNDDAWTQFSNAMTVRKNSEGQFDGDIHPKDGVKFHRNLILLSRFTPHEPVQPTSVVRIVGKQGEALGGINNPQVGQLFGETCYLEALARVPLLRRGSTSALTM